MLFGIDRPGYSPDASDGIQPNYGGLDSGSREGWNSGFIQMGGL
ncbi:MAG: hypothetical protein ABIP52_00620 [Cyclobacteriaceae bacterium]